MTHVNQEKDSDSAAFCHNTTSHHDTMILVQLNEDGDAPSPKKPHWVTFRMPIATPKQLSPMKRIPRSQIPTHAAEPLHAKFGWVSKPVAT